MNIINHRPAARGVSQLMYVGDVDTSAHPLSTVAKVALAALAAWLLLGRR